MFTRLRPARAVLSRQRSSGGRRRRRVDGIRGGHGQAGHSRLRGVLHTLPQSQSPKNCVTVASHKGDGRQRIEHRDRRARD